MYFSGSIFDVLESSSSQDETLHSRLQISLMKKVPLPCGPKNINSDKVKAI